MALIWIIVCLFLGGILAAVAERFQEGIARWFTLITLMIAGVLCYSLLSVEQVVVSGQSSQWILYYQAEWIPQLGISFLFAVDTIGYTLIALTVFLGFIALFSGWEEIKEKAGLFYFNLLWALAGVVGIFSALDLFLFFVFWEVMLIPMFLIIIIWGHENRYYAGLKFFIYTQASSLLLLVAMLILVFLYWQQNGVVTFSWFELLDTETSESMGMLLMLGFFIAFLVKLPGIPVHNWLPDAHTQAPTPGSVILAGILLKTGAYGLIRFVVPLFPDAAERFTPVALTLGVVSILYAAKLAFAQNDIKRLIAYSSISHMGFVTIAVFSWSALALQGALVQMVAHGLSSAGLFALAGAIQHRYHTRALDKLGGLWSLTPRMAAMALFFVVAALGLPGLGNFVGEFMVLLGTYQLHPVFAIIATLGMIAAPVYALIVLQKSFFGRQGEGITSSAKIVDFGGREMLMMGTLVVALIALGFFPGILTTFADSSLSGLIALTN